MVHRQKLRNENFKKYLKRSAFKSKAAKTTLANYGSSKPTQTSVSDCVLQNTRWRIDTCFLKNISAQFRIFLHYQTQLTERAFQD